MTLASQGCWGQPQSRFTTPSVWTYGLPPQSALPFPVAGSHPGSCVAAVCLLPTPSAISVQQPQHPCTHKCSVSSPGLNLLVAAQPLWNKIHSTLSLCDLVPVRSGPQSAALWPCCPSFCPSSSFWPQPFTLTASFPWTTGPQTFARLTAPSLRTFSIPSPPTPALPPAYPSPFSLGPVCLLQHPT